MAMPTTLSEPSYRRVVLICLFFVAAIVLTGASVRLSGSGLGCPSWPRCTDTQLVDVSEPHRAVEQINRLFTGAVAIAVALAFAGAARLRPYRRDLAWFGAFLIAGVFLQAIIGGIVVLLELQWQSVALHFMASFVLLYGNLELLRRSREPVGLRLVTVPRPVKVLTEAVFANVLLVVALGTVVTGAGPHGGDADVARLGWPVANAARVHSFAVWVLVVLTIALIARARRAGVAVLLARAEILLLCLIVQGAIGYLQWFNRVPPVLVAVHVAGAVVVFSTATWLRFASYEVRPAPATVDGGSRPVSTATSP